MESLRKSKVNYFSSRLALRFVYRIPIKPSAIPSKQVRIILAKAFTIIAITRAMVHRTMPAMITGTALRIP